MEIVLHATLAGGVVMGASAGLISYPGFCILIGSIAGIISAFGYAYFSKGLQKTTGLHDTCGVNNLFGMPGIIGGIISTICAATAQRYVEKDEQPILYPDVNSSRSFQQQAGMQIGALAVSLCIALISGAFAGFTSSRLGRTIEFIFDDEENWYDCTYDLELREDEVDENGE
jgi:ammonium transporter Rh